MLYLALLSSLVDSCKESSALENTLSSRLSYMDTTYDPLLDDEGFQICDEDRIRRTYMFSDDVSYEAEIRRLTKYYSSGFKTAAEEVFSGYVSITFIVNCQGKSDRFRSLTTTTEFKRSMMASIVEDQLVQLTKDHDKWEILYSDGEAIDYYQNLIFIIENGTIKDILI